MSNFIQLTFASLLTVFTVGTATAGTVTIDIDPSAGTLLVEANDATTDEILTRLGNSLNFEVERIGELSDNGMKNRRLTGSAQQVLDRLLERDNHMVISSAQTRTVDRVILFGPRQAEQAQAAETAVARPATATAGAPLPVPAAVIAPVAKPAAAPAAKPHPPRDRASREITPTKASARDDETAQPLSRRTAMNAPGIHPRHGM